MTISRMMKIRRISLTVILNLSLLIMGHSQETPAGKTINVNGTTLFYQVTGSGEPLLLLHGWTQTSGFWKQYANRLATQYKVYAIDLRGHGRSSPLTKEFSIQQSAKDIAEMVRTLGLKEVKAIGLSFGGMVLLEVANAHKDMIQAMAIIGASYQYDGALAQKDKRAFTYDKLDPSFKAYLLSQHAHGEEQVRAMFNPNLDYRINLSEHQLKSLQTKVLIINGDTDEIADVRQAADMKRYIPRSALWIIPNTGHLAINESNREEFLGLLKTIFDGL